MFDRNVSLRNKNKNDGPHVSRQLKVELQTLRISEESERLLYDTLKNIYGSVCIYKYFYKFIIIILIYML